MRPPGRRAPPPEETHLRRRDPSARYSPRGLRSSSRLLAACLCAAACTEAPHSDGGLALATTGTATPAPVRQDGFEVPPPPFSDGAFPCTDCHVEEDLPVNPRRRRMRFAHQEIVLKHDEENRWCLDCHDAEDRDQLHLAGGEPLPFEESYRLCGQCHGDKLRDWRAGVHGRRTGRFDGEKSYLLCVHCHDAHDPAFRPIAPMPAPEPPVRTP